MAVMTTFEIATDTRAQRIALEKIRELVEALHGLPLSPEDVCKVGDLTLQLVELTLTGVEISVRERVADSPAAGGAV